MRAGVKGEAVHDVFAAVEQQRADDDVERTKRREAEGDQRGQRQPKDGERRGRAVAKECPEHRRPP
jgi:hypothetical protein